jgi:hypothetical protein
MPTLLSEDAAALADGEKLDMAPERAKIDGEADAADLEMASWRARTASS